MKTPIAIHNLWHQGAKTLVSIFGVAFALLLVFMQLGFMGAVSHTATNVLKTLRFDILIRAHDYIHLYEAGKVERKWLDTAKGLDGVTAVRPFWITIQNWKTIPSPDSQGQERLEEVQYLPIAVMACEPENCVFNLPEIEQQISRLQRDDALLIDDGTHDDYGPWDGRKFSNKDVEKGRGTEIYSKDFRIAGTYKLGTGLASNGAVLMGDRGFDRIWPWSTRTWTTFGLIEVENKEPEAVQQTISALRQRVYAEKAPPNAPTGIASTIRDWLGAAPTEHASGAVEVLSADDAMRRETYRWLWQTPIGLIFQLGVLLAMVVGAAIVYMILSTDVANRLPEYATLLAMGYSRRYLASIVMTQAVALSILGFLASWGIAEVLYRVTYWLSNMPLEMNVGRVVLVLVLGMVMCCVSGLLALRKLWKAEPANLF
jgi:putative ABC transport system permease protein